MFDKIKKFLWAKVGSTVQQPAVDLEEVWRIREEEVYPSLFGAQSRGIFPFPSRSSTTPSGKSKLTRAGCFMASLNLHPQRLVAHGCT